MTFARHDACLSAGQYNRRVQDCADNNIRCCQQNKIVRSNHTFLLASRRSRNCIKDEVSLKMKFSKDNVGAGGWSRYCYWCAYAVAHSPRSRDPAEYSMTPPKQRKCECGDGFLLGLRLGHLPIVVAVVLRSVAVFRQIFALMNNWSLPRCTTRT